MGNRSVAELARLTFPDMRANRMIEALLNAAWERRKPLVPRINEKPSLKFARQSRRAPHDDVCPSSPNEDRDSTCAHS